MEINEKGMIQNDSGRILMRMSFASPLKAIYNVAKSDASGSLVARSTLPGARIEIIHVAKSIANAMLHFASIFPPEAEKFEFFVLQIKIIVVKRIRIYVMA